MTNNNLFDVFRYCVYNTAFRIDNFTAPACREQTDGIRKLIFANNNNSITN